MKMEKMQIEANKELLKAMDTVVRWMNDEDALTGWLMCGVPDGWTERDIEDMAEDEWSMDETCKCFRRTMRHANAGWYTYPFGADGVGMVYGEDK